MFRSLVLAGWSFCFVPVAFGQAQLIGNGGFETGNLAPWQFTGAGEQVANTPGFAHSGFDYLSMGSINGAHQTIFQTITIPTNTVSALLSYYWGVISSDTSGADQLNVWVVNSNRTILATAETESNFSRPNSYFHTIFDLTPYIGQQTVSIVFAVTTDAAFGSLTTFYIDDVGVLAAASADLPANDYFTNRTALAGVSVTNQANNTFATREPGEPNHGGNAGGRSLWWSWTAPSAGTVSINTAGSSFITLLGAYTGTVATNLARVASDNGINESNGTARARFNVAAGVEYEIAVDGINGEFGNVVLSLSFNPDTNAPKVSISSPASGTKETNTAVIVKGTASDNIAVAQVQYRLENASGTNDYQRATGTNTWSGVVTNLAPGLNTVRARAIDTSGNVSATVTRSFTYVVVNPLLLTTTGTGTVSPNLNGHLLGVGSSYTLTAKPMSPAYLFGGWTGDVVSDNPKLIFIMQSNMVLQANFIPNPFIPVTGNYQGLFYDTNDLAPESSGFFSATVNNRGSFSAKLQLAGKSYSRSGQFTLSGAFSNSVARAGLSSLSLQLQLDLAGHTLAGQLSDGIWTAQLLANRAVYSKINQAPQNGTYTLLIPGAEESEQQPGGDGFGTVNVDTSGNVTLSGTLADGTKISQKSFLSTEGEWPFYASLYSGKGSAFGWFTFTNEANTDVDGLATWFKLPQPASKFYPGGFTNQTSVMASRYLFTNNVSVLNFTTGRVWLANGNLSQSFTNQIVLGNNNKVTDTNKLSLSIMTKSGLFKGSVLSPDTGKPISFSGVVLEKQGFGSGFFLGTNQAGRVYFGP